MGDLTNTHNESAVICPAQKEYLAAKQAYNSWELSLDAKFVIAMNFLESGPAAPLGLAAPITEIIEYLEQPDLKQTDYFARIRPPQIDLDTHAKLIGYKASKFDKIHTDPEQDYLGNIIKSLEKSRYRHSTSDGPDFWEAQKDEDGNPIYHAADQKIARSETRYESEHQKKIDRDIEKQSELDGHRSTVINQLKRVITDGLFTASRHWPTKLSYSSNWIDHNVEGDHTISSDISRAASNVSKIGLMMEEMYSDSIDNVVAVLLRSKEIGKSQKEDISPEK